MLWTMLNAVSVVSKVTEAVPDEYRLCSSARASSGYPELQVNFRGEIRAQQRARHPTAPQVVQWHSGVLLPRGVSLTNGSWSPRYDW